MTGTDQSRRGYLRRVLPALVVVAVAVGGATWWVVQARDGDGSVAADPARPSDSAGPASVGASAESNVGANPDRAVVVVPTDAPRVPPVLPDTTRRIPPPGGGVTPRFTEPAAGGSVTAAGEDTATVPPVVGTDAPYAVAALRHRGFEVRIQWREEPGRPADGYCRVTRQSLSGSVPVDEVRPVVIEVLVDPSDRVPTEFCRNAVRLDGVAASASSAGG